MVHSDGRDTGDATPGACCKSHEKHDFESILQSYDERVRSAETQQDRMCREGYASSLPCLRCPTKEVDHKRILQGILCEDLGHQFQADGVQNTTATALEQGNHPGQDFMFPSLDQNFATGAFAVVKSFQPGVHETHTGALALEEFPNVLWLQLPQVMDAYTWHRRPGKFLFRELLPGKM